MFLNLLHRLIALSEDLMLSFKTLHIKMKIQIYKGKLSSLCVFFFVSS